MEIKAVQNVMADYTNNIRNTQVASVESETSSVVATGNNTAQENALPLKPGTIVISEEEQQKKMEQLQHILDKHNIEISYNDEVHRYAIRVTDSQTNEVVKEIPSEKMLDMFAKMLELEGLLVDEKT